MPRFRPSQSETHRPLARLPSDRRDSTLAQDRSARRLCCAPPPSCDDEPSTPVIHIFIIIVIVSSRRIRGRGVLVNARPHRETSDLYNTWVWCWSVYVYSPRRCGSVAQMALCSLRTYHHTHDYQQSKPIISVVLSCRRLGAVLSSVEIRATISVASVSVGCMCGYTPKRPCATRSCSASSTHGGLPDRQSSSRQREKADSCSGQPDQERTQMQSSAIMF
jgi:hypothetical protein